MKTYRSLLLLTMFSTAVQAQQVVDCFGEIIETSSVTKIDLFHSNVTNNTLHLSDGELRYENVGIVRDRPVDLVVTVASGDYTDILDVWENRNKDVSKMNGRKPGSQFGNINLQTVRDKPQSGEGSFKFCFHDKETNELTKVDTFHWTVFDLDERGNDNNLNGIGQKEKFIMDIAQVGAYQLWPNESESEVKLSCEDGTEIPCVQGVRTVFHSSTAGTGQDNPTDPNHMTPLQKSRSITFTFQDTDCWTFTYDHYCPVDQDHEKIFPMGYDPRYNKPKNNNNNNYDTTHCRGYTGGNFLFSGDAEEIIKEGECVTPPPTKAPLPTEAPTLSPIKCVNDVIVKKTVGETEFPSIPTKPVTIVGKNDDQNTVTVALSQYWTGKESSIGHLFASYKETMWEEKCLETKNIIGDGAIFDTITIQCNIMSPMAHLEICIADDLSNNILLTKDDADIPKCCHPDIPPDYGTVCYTLEISCNSECIKEESEDRRGRHLLRGRNRE